MQNQTATMERQTPGSPVDNNTYNLLQTLANKLEAIDVYEKYLKDADGETRQFFESCREADQKSAQQAVDLLRREFGGGR